MFGVGTDLTKEAALFRVLLATINDFCNPWRQDNAK